MGYVVTIADRVAARDADAAAAVVAGGKGAEKAAKKADAEAAGMALQSLTVRGAKGLAYMVATARRFIFRGGFPLNVAEVRVDPRSTVGEGSAGGAPDWEDENVRVWYVPVYSDQVDNTVPVRGRRDSSARKRPRDEFEGDAGEGTGQGATVAAETQDAETPVSPEEQERLDSLFVDNIVKDMFSSTWKLDTLVKTTLHQAQLPAKLFVRGSDGKIQRYEGPLPGDPGVGDVPDIPVLVRSPWPAALIEALPPISPSSQSLCYIVKNRPRRGRFNRDRAVELGVPVSMFKPLTGGESVTLANGTVVTPDMVLGDPVGGYGFAIVDLPDPSYIESFLARAEWADAQLMDKVVAIYWFLGQPGMADDPRLQAFMRKFAEGNVDRRNYVLASDTCPNTVAFESAAQHQMKLRSIDPDRFPMPYFDNAVIRPGLVADDRPSTPKTPKNAKAFTSPSYKTPLTQVAPSPPPNTPAPVNATAAGESPAAVNSPASQATLTVPAPPARPPFYSGRTGSMVQTGPRLAFKDTAGDMVAMESLEESGKLRPEVAQLAASAQAEVSDPAFLARVAAAQQDLPCPDAEVVCLGTGSAMPSKYRNVSATLVRVPGVGSYLFDCGENTLGQLRRTYGPEGTVEVLRDLRAIWISHLHADHHLGTASVVRAWHEATIDDRPGQQLLVASHHHFLAWLREYAQLEGPAVLGLSRVRLAPLELPGGARGEKDGTVANPLIFSLEDMSRFGLSRVDAVRVEHCLGALACVFTWPSGLKVAYSGDCRPSDAFARLGKGATLLIHEATFEAGREGDAAAKKHSSMAEALDVARKMRARRVLLTHFSQRYQKIPVINGEGSDGNGSGKAGQSAETGQEDDARPVKDQVVLMAFDHMRVRLGDFAVAQKFFPALQRLLEEVEGTGEL